MGSVAMQAGPGLGGTGPAVGNTDGFIVNCGARPLEVGLTVDSALRETVGVMVGLIVGSL